MRIRCIIPLWKRPQVTLMCLKEMKRVCQESKHEIEVTCVISETEWIEVCTSLGFEYFEYKNDTLGEKLNAGIKHVLKHDWDYLMVMNSDSMVTVDLIDNVYEYNKPFFGINRLHFVNYYTGEVKEYCYDFFTILGVAKMVSREAIEKCPSPYREANKGMDDSFLDSMLFHGYTPYVVHYDGIHAIDIKSEVNIWGWDHFQKKEVFQKAKSLDVSYLTFFENLCVQDHLVKE
jgi:hypothetical protein